MPVLTKTEHARMIFNVLMLDEPRTIEDIEPDNRSSALDRRLKLAQIAIEVAKADKIKPDQLIAKWEYQNRLD